MIPLLKNGSIYGAIKAQRNGTKVKYSFSQDANILDLFDKIIFTPREKIKPLKDTFKSNNSTARYDYECTIKTLKTWYPVGEGGYWGERYYESCDWVWVKDYPSIDTDLHLDGWGQGGGGSSSGDSGESSEIKNIIDNLEGYPCAQDLIKEIPDLNNDLAKKINDLFGKNDKINIIFKAKSGLGPIDGEAFSSYSKEFGTFKSTIYLNDEVLRYATKEYILVTMYHEVLHSYLDYELSVLGKDEFNTKYPDIFISSETTSNGLNRNIYSFLDSHQKFGIYLQDLKNALYSYNPNLSTNVVSALVKTGITTTTSEEQNINLSERDVRLNNYSGTKCP